jgi:hypothetical protein
MVPVPRIPGPEEHVEDVCRAMSRRLQEPRVYGGVPRLRLPVRLDADFKAILEGAVRPQAAQPLREGQSRSPRRRCLMALPR